MANKTGRHYNIGNNRGGTVSKETAKKISDKNKRGSFFSCKTCGNEFWRKPSQIKNGENKYCSRKCYHESEQNKGPKPHISKLRSESVGEKSPTWKGGITSENARIRSSKKYKDWRQSVFLRDDYTCQDCGDRSMKGNYVYLHAHHIEPFSKRKDLAFQVSNGITLCKGCHYKRHTNDKNVSV